MEESSTTSTRAGGDARRESHGGKEGRKAAQRRKQGPIDDLRRKVRRDRRETTGKTPVKPTSWWDLPGRGNRTSSARSAKISKLEAGPNFWEGEKWLTRKTPFITAQGGQGTRTWKNKARKSGGKKLFYRMEASDENEKGGLFLRGPVSVARTSRGDKTSEFKTAGRLQYGTRARGRNETGSYILAQRWSAGER